MNTKVVGRQLSSMKGPTACSSFVTIKVLSGFVSTVTQMVAGKLWIDQCGHTHRQDRKHNQEGR